MRFPFSTSYIDRNGQSQDVDWIAVDLDLLERYGIAFRGDWRQLRKSRRWIQKHRQTHSVQALSDGVLVMKRGGAHQEALELALDQALRQPLPNDPKRRSNRNAP